MSERRAAHHAVYQTKRTGRLDLARPAPRRRHKTLRQLCALLLGLTGLALLSMAVWGRLCPGGWMMP